MYTFMYLIHLSYRCTRLTTLSLPRTARRIGCRCERICQLMTKKRDKVCVATSTALLNVLTTMSSDWQVNFADIEPRKTQIVKSVPLRNSESSNPNLSTSPLRKAASVQNLKNTGQSIKRASSIDNLCRPTASSLQKNKQSSLAKTQVTIK